jgi:leucyl aminopeptidase
MIPTSTNVAVELSGKVPAKVDAVVVLMEKGGKPGGVERLSAGDRAAVEALVSAKSATGKANELATQVVTEPSVHRVMVAGVGEAKKLTPQALREAAGVVAKAVRKQKLRNVAVIVPEGLDEPHAGVEALVSGLMLGSFVYREYKGSAEAKKGEAGAKEPQTRFTLVTADAGARARAAVEMARHLADGQNLARTIASRPGNDINPPSLAKVAQGVAKEAGLASRVLDEKELARLGMGGILAVGSGSPTPPRLIVLEHKGAGKKQNSAPVLVVGKSITFDTGGISIKPAEKMGEMVFDKCGGMAVLGLMYALAKMDFPGHVVGVLTSAENHVSGTAYRPGDIITLYNGVTVEITNTDAEGRLVLADAIAWGIETYKPAAVVDLATLTSGCVVALGHTMAGLMSNDDDLSDQLLEAAEAAGEKVWRLPVGDDQRDMLKSHHADIINSAGRWASPLTGAAFVSFALPAEKPHVPWAHFDIAGVADTDKELPLYTKGATGWGVRTLYQWLMARISRKG